MATTDNDVNITVVMRKLSCKSLQSDPLEKKKKLFCLTQGKNIHQNTETALENFNTISP